MIHKSAQILSLSLSLIFPLESFFKKPLFDIAVFYFYKKVET